jgi:hypothetical protein
MTTLERLNGWKETGIISAAQHEILRTLVHKERFSVFVEINAFLCIGVLALVGGLGWTVQTYFNSLGDTFILAALSLILAACLTYCFSKAPAYSNLETESPNLVLDYVIYLACLVFSVELSYLEFRFEILRDHWPNYLLFSTATFFGLAYRFDNRFVLSLALSSLAGWFGIRVSRFEFIKSEQLQLAGLLYATVVALAGAGLFQRRLKKHFFETYLHVAANAAFVALVSGIASEQHRLIFFAMLIGLSGLSILMGIRFRRFAFVVYGTIYGYIGLSIELLRSARELAPVLAYFILTGIAVIALIAKLARRLGRTA